MKKVLGGLVFAMFASSVFGVEISCPVALWDDMSALFEMGDPLDLLPQVRVFGGEFKVDAEGILVSSSGAVSAGGASLSVDEDFAGLTAERSVELVIPELQQPEISTLSDGVGLWIKTDPYVYLSYRFRDASSRTFSIPAHRQKSPEWEYAVAPLKSVVLWDHSGSKKVQLPAHLISVQLSTVAGDFSFDFSAKLRGLQRVSRPDETQPQKVKIEVPNPPIGLVYRPGQTVGAVFSAPDKNSEVCWKFVEYGGKVLDEGSARGKVETKQTLGQAGHYRFLVELIENGKRTDYRVLSLAAIEDNQPVHDRIGLCGHWNRWYYTLDTLDLLPLIGINRLRDHVAWHQVETQKGIMTMPKKMDQFLEEARKRGIQGMTIINGKATFYGGGVPRTPEAIDAFKEYCKFVADKEAGVYEELELWNEWSNGTGMEGSGFEPTPENYVWLAEQVIPDLRKALPKGVEFVGFGGENPYRFEHEITGMLKAGGGKYFDSISLHPYRQPFPPEIAHNPQTEPVDETMKKFAALSRKYEGPDKIQITEIGYPVFRMGWGVSETEHARLMVRTLAMLHSVPEVGEVYWYALRDEFEVPLRGNAPTSISFAQHGYGLFRDKSCSYAPKPAAVAMAVYVRQTAGAEFGTVQRLDNEVFRLDVSEPGGKPRCSMLWTLRNPVQFRVEGTNLKATDLMGRNVPVKDGALTVSQDVLYLRGNDIRLIQP